ncbi:MAG TPA: mechanosensitive ion channel family protein [Deltaproteobacteria bacterium]|nr:mechanosensitive ion channel family protein [Deltaproteobacteria bacterium]
MDIGWRELFDSARVQGLLLASVRIVFILAGGWAASIVLKKVLAKFKARLIEKGAIAHDPASETLKRADTLTRLIRQAVLIGLWAVVTLVALKELGIEIGPILAGAGVMGLAVGFGAQNLVRDVISGFFFILEDQVRVGDVAVINGTPGLVEQINFRTIVLRDLEGTVHVFPNGTVTTISNRTKNWSAYVFDLGVAYKEDVDRVIGVVSDVGKALRQDPVFGPLILEDLEVFGVDRFDDSAVVIKGRIKTKPMQQWYVGREFLRRIKRAFDEHGIEIPFPHRTIYMQTPITQQRTGDRGTNG